MRGFFLLALMVVTVGCASSEVATLPIYETPGMYVRLEMDRSFGTSHSHPADITAHEIARVLTGIIIEEPLAKIPILDDTSQPRRHLAFTEKDAALLAPFLSMALQRATSEEIVTFYQSRPPSGIRREVTSGGVFVNGEELHVVLANYRSPTHYMADPGVADTNDDWLVPMRPIAPQRGALDFEPKAALRKVETPPLLKLFQWDRRELIVLPKQIPAVSRAADADGK